MYLIMKTVCMEPEKLWSMEGKIILGNLIYF